MYRFILQSIRRVSKISINNLKLWMIFLIALITTLSNLAIIPAFAAQDRSNNTITEKCVVPKDIQMIRPDPDGVRTKVSVGMYVIDLKGINAVSQTFAIDTFFTAQWHDPRLSAKALEKSLAGCRLSLSDIWHPDLSILNIQNIMHIKKELVRLDKNGNVRYGQRVRADLSSPLNLRDFPFDSQMLPIKIVSLLYGPKEIEFSVNESTTGRRKDLTITGWTIKLEEPRITKEYIAPQNRNLSRIDFWIQAQRDMGFFTWKMVVPIGLIVFMSWIPFWIDPSQVGPRSGISTATVFTIIAFTFSLSLLLPRVDYLTRLDKFVTFSTILVFLTLGIVVFSSRLASIDKKTLALTIDRWARFIHIALFVIIVVVTLLI